MADPDSDLPHMVPTPARFAKLMAALGVSNASRVVFYDQKGLRLRGARLVADAALRAREGGGAGWRPAEVAARGPADREPASRPPPRPRRFVADFRADRLRGIGDIKRIVRQGGGEALILDARAKGRFDGTAPEPRAGLPSGHMPGAANLPYGELLNPDGTMLDPAALRARFEAAGVDAERPVVTSCGTGVTACILALGLVRAGLPEAGRLRRLLDRMGLAARNPEGDGLMPDDAPPGTQAPPTAAASPRA